MTHFIAFGRGGIVERERILLMASFRSVPIKRWLSKIDPGRIINLTYGYPRESVLLLEGGYLVITSQTIDQLAKQLAYQRMDPDEPTFK